MRYLGEFVFVIVLLRTSFADKSFKKPIFSTKTPYFWVKDLTEFIPDNQYSTIIQHGQTCQLEGLNVLFRHGARFPTLKWIKRMTVLHAKLNINREVASKYPFLQQWSNPFLESQEAIISPLGKKEIQLISRRFAKRFKRTFEDHFDLINFTYTYKSRTQTSYRIFYDGLNKSLTSGFGKPHATEDNMKLRFYDSCPKFQKEVKNNDQSQVQHEMFAKGNEMTNVILKVRSKVGFLNLTIDEAMVMQQYCVLELGIYNTSSWCQFFDEKDLKVIDYLNDLEDYYEWGYGYDINWQQSCPFTSHVFKKFDQHIKSHEDRNRTVPIDISFGHAETVMPIFTAFGLFRDSKPLTANGFRSSQNRLFHVADIVPFSANLAIGLYNCEHSTNYVLKMYVNEEAVDIPACGQKVCPYSEVRNYYNHLVNCNFTNLCNADYNGQSVIG